MMAGFLGLSAVLACNDSTAASSDGTISVKVVDASETGVQTVNVDLYKVETGGAILWRAASTSSNGMAFFGVDDGSVEAGDYYVHVSFVTGYQLAPGEINDKPLRVQGGDNVSVVFHVVASGPNH
jgi:5-hydroxyisourate hydrolase-like protein (transthyretin family)